MLVADELSDATGELEVLGKRGNGNARVEAEDAVVDAIDSLASRIAGLAEKLEGP